MMSHPEESNEHLESPLTDVTVVIEGTYRGQVMEIVSKFYYQLMHEGNDLKGVLKFTLKMLQHVLV